MSKDSNWKKFFQFLKDGLTAVKVYETIKEYWPVIKPIAQKAFEWIVIPIIVNYL